MTEPIDTDAAYAVALAELLRLVDLDPEAGSEAAERLSALAEVLEQYEKKRFPLPDPVADIAAYPWALRVWRFDDQGLEKGQRQRWEAEAGRPLDPKRDWGLWNPPRSQWGDGPWQTEPDLVEWREDGIPYPLIIIRGMPGAWCGYAGLPPGHPLFGGGPGCDSGLAITQAVTWASACADDTDGQLVPTGEPPDCWWLGFDCAHPMQYAPRIDALCRSFADADALCRSLADAVGLTTGLVRSLSHGSGRILFDPAAYVTLDDCRHMTIEFARELLALAQPEER